MKYKIDNQNMDASENAFFSRQLESIRAQAFEVQYPELKARQMIPVNNSVSPGAEVYTYRSFQHFGNAEEIADYGDDLNRSDVDGREESSRIRAIGLSYAYSVQEIRNAILAGTDLKSHKAMACRRGIEQRLDSVAMVGGLRGLNGILSLTGVNSYTPASTIAGAASTDDAMDMLHAMVNKIVDDSNEVEQPDTVIFPLALYNYLSSKRMGDSSEKSMLQHFIDSSSYITQVFRTHKAETAGAGSVTRTVVYKRSPDKLEWILPLEFTQHAPQARNMEEVTNCEARTGGVVVYFPRSILYADGL